tara:strand:- start:47 stop:313 length:267 start_codon:yes stop_codon:yes gene_type:complete
LLILIIITKTWDLNLKFKPGDLVSLVGINGEVILTAPIALVLSGGLGYSVECPDDIAERFDPEEIYTILFDGGFEYKISADWLIKIKS